MIDSEMTTLTDELWREHAADLVRFATVLVGPSDAQDLVVDAFLRSAPFVADDSVLNKRAYLYRAVASRAHDLRRSRSGLAVLATISDGDRDLPVTSPTAESSSPAGVVPERFTISSELWPITQATTAEDGSTYQVAIDLEGKQGPGSEDGGGAAEIWTGPAALTERSRLVDSGLYVPVSEAEVLGTRADVYAREQFSWVITWASPSGTPLTIHIEGPRAISIDDSLAEIEPASQAQWDTLVDSINVTSAPTSTSLLAG